MMRERRKPVVVVSKCLGFGRCRYDGEGMSDAFVEALRPFVRFRTVCPEMELGLGCPRPRIRVVERNGRALLYQPETRRGLTRRMARFSHDFLSGLKRVNGFILKSRSPSCGLRGTEIFASKTAAKYAYRGKGLFARAVFEAFPDLPMEDERRLANPRVRARFLRRLFACIWQKPPSAMTRTLNPF